MAAAAINLGDRVKLLDRFSSKRESTHLAKGDQMAVGAKDSQDVVSPLPMDSSWAHSQALINTSIIHTLKRKKLSCYSYPTSVFNFTLKIQMECLLLKILAKKKIKCNY